MKIYHLFYAVISDLAEAANLKQQQQKQTIKIRLETVTELKILFFGVDLHNLTRLFQATKDSEPFFHLNL